MEALDICYSGGAIGADTEWGKAAHANGHAVIHYIFEGHDAAKTLDFTSTLSQKELNTADEFLLKANKKLCRKFPCREQKTSNLLRRNYFQIKESESLYAIASFEYNEEWDEWQVAGGTGWAVQMFIDAYGITRPCYVYDQEKYMWFSYETRFNDLGWWPLERPLVPEGKWTGIGTRKLTKEGKSAIWRLWN